jgi:hypothetical protein
MIYGCTRVSTDGHNVHAQVAQLRAVGVTKVYSEKASRNKMPLAKSTEPRLRFDIIREKFIKANMGYFAHR